MNKKMKGICLGLLAMFALSSPLSAGGDVFEIDAGHSAVMFSIVHFGVSKAYGRFNEFEGSVTYDKANPSAGKVNVTIKAESIDTNHERRDKHLRSPDFFNAKQFGDIKFSSTKVEAAGEGKLKVSGDLTMLGVTKPVTIHVDIVGAGKHPRGGDMVGFHATATIKRSSFGMNYGIDQGALSDEVELIFSLETIKKEA